MPGTILLSDYEAANKDELAQHLADLMARAPTPSDSLTNPVIQAPAPEPIPLIAAPTPSDSLTNPVIQAAPEPPPQAQQTRDELQAHVDSLLAPPTPTTPPDAVSSPSEPPRPLQLLGEGLTSLNAGAQNVRQELQNHLTSLLAPPTPAPDVAPTPSDSLTNPVGTGNAAPPDRSLGLQDYARTAAQRAGIDPDIFVRQIQQESGFNPTAKSPAGAIGVAQFMPATAAGLNLDPTDPYAALDAAARMDAQQLKQYGGDWGKTLAAYNAGPGAVEKFGGIPPFEETQRYVANILGGAKAVVQGASQAISGALNQARGTDVSQFGDSQLTASEAAAACGPAAAVRFAQRFGRNPTLREATDLAASVGWTQGQGMAGIGSEKSLLDKMGVATKLVSGPDWGTFADEARTGNPVIISTAGHYFTADNWDPTTNKFHVGRSGLDLKGGAEWMTPEQMTSLMGQVQGGLLADNPTTPTSTATRQGFAAPAAATDQQAASVDQPRPLQLLGEGFSALGSGAQAVASGAQKTAEGGLKIIDNAINSAVADTSGPQTSAMQPTPSDTLTNPVGTRNAPEQPSAQLTGQPAGGIAESQPLNPIARGVSEAVGGIQSPQTGNPLVDVIGTGASALGTAAQQVGTGLRNITPTSELARGALGQEQLVTENRDLFDQQQRLVDEFAGAQARGDDAAMDRIRQEMDALQAQLPDARNRDVLHAAAERNPALPLVETGANLAGAAAAAPLVAEGAPLAARALATAIDPGTGLPSLIVRGLEDLRPGATRILTDAAKTEPPPTVAQDVAGQLQKMPGTAELAPVRETVPQTGSDLLQAMLEQARQRGADPDKVAALQKQIDAFDPEAATRRVLGGAQEARISLRAATTLGGAAAGGAAGNASTPDDALTIPTPLGDIPIERIGRTAAGVGLGAGLGSATGYRGPLEQRVLENLRQSGLVSGPAVAKPWRGVIPEAVDLTKQSILSGPPGRIADVIGNTIELGRQPAALWMGGRGDDALAGLMAAKSAIREGATNALSAVGGRQLPALGTGVGSDIPRRSAMYRILSATDAFTRTLGEYQGMASEANRLLRDAGMTPSDPGAAAYLAAHAHDLYNEGARSGAQSVFGQGGTTATARSGLENMFRVYNNFKEGLLSSPDRKSQLAGALLDFEIPFSGVPVRMVDLVARRTPPGTQIRGAVRALKAIGAGDMPAAQRAVGETAMESTIQLLIAKNIADDNIRGPGDPDHPNSIRMPGMGWVSMNEWGAYALPMQVMAAFAEGAQKGGQNIPPSTPGATDLEKYVNYYGPRFNAALNASMKPLVQAVPGMNMVRALSAAQEGGATGAATKLASDAVNRMVVPGVARFMENLTDPVARDVAKKGVQSLWEGPMSAWPGLAERLPEKIDPTTGEPLQKSRSGAGALVGVQQDVASPLTLEADRLNKEAGFTDVVAPKTYPDSISIAGAEVKLSPDEQRKVTEITGKQLGALAERLKQKDYLDSTDERKAQLMKAFISSAEKSRLTAVRDVIGQDELRNRILAAQSTAGRLNTQATPP